MTNMLIPTDVKQVRARSWVVPTNTAIFARLIDETSSD